MARSKVSTSNEHETEVDLVPMMDLSLNLTFFFVILTTLVQDDATAELTLPVSSVAFRNEESEIPDSIILSVDKGGHVLSWGRKLSLREPADVQTLSQLLRLEANRSSSAGASGDGTTVILRMDGDSACGDFQQLMDACRAEGFNKFVFRTGVGDGG